MQINTIKPPIFWKDKPMFMNKQKNGIKIKLKMFEKNLRFRIRN